MTVQLVLDVSALHAYGTVDGAIAIGELAYMIEEDEPEDQIGIPAAAFMAAYASGDNACRQELSRILADVRLTVGERDDPEQSSFAILPLKSDNLADASELEREFPGQGHAMVEAIRHGARLVSSEPMARPPVGLDVIELGTGGDDPLGWDLAG